MAYDTAHYLTGTASSPLESFANTSGTVLTNNTRTGTAIPPNRLYIAELRISEAPTGTSPTLDMTIRASSTTTGTGPHVLATFTQMTASTTTLAPESSSGVTKMAARTRAFRVDADNPYLHVGLALSTTAAFNGVSVVLIPIDNANN